MANVSGVKVFYGAHQACSDRDTVCFLLIDHQVVLGGMSQDLSQLEA